MVGGTVAWTQPDAQQLTARVFLCKTRGSHICVLYDSNSSLIVLTILRLSNETEGWPDWLIVLHGERNSTKDEK